MSAPRQGKRLARLRTLFEERGIRPRPRRGQNFLLDRNQVSFIARAGDPSSEDVVLEVGPGTGFLTTELAASGCRLLAVEIDAALAAIVREETAAYPGVEVMETDVLANKNRIAPAVTERLAAILDAAPAPGRLLCISNLPYSAGTPFVANLASSPLPWAEGIFLLQYEVAARMLAAPGTKDYGGLAITTALAGAAEILRKVPPQVFWPRPRVASAVVHVTYRPPEERSAYPWRPLRRVTSAVFGARRKTLRNALKGVLPKEAGGAERLLAEAGLDPDGRGEALAPAVFVDLAHALERCEGGGDG